MSAFTRWFFWLAFIALGGFLGYKLGQYFLEVPDFYEIIKNLKNYCKQLQSLYVNQTQLKEMDMNDPEKSTYLTD